ncbi:SRPBCC domain-containing protein [Bremerella sp. T1]
MLFHVPVPRVFQAFVDPAITTRFWFSHSSGPLKVGEDVQWEWRMFGVSTRVHVQEMEPDRRILMEWGTKGNEPLSTGNSSSVTRINAWSTLRTLDLSERRKK